MKNLLHVRRSLHDLKKLFSAFQIALSNFVNFAKSSCFYSGDCFNENRCNARSAPPLVSIETHRIEKGLSHRNRRDVFSSAAKNRLTTLLNFFSKEISAKHRSYSCEVLSNSSLKQPLSGVGFKQVSCHQFQNTMRSPDYFWTSRYSVRDFNEKELIDLSTIKKAVALARNTPSPCNRQPWKVYICSSKKTTDLALSLQSGNSGFGHTAQYIVIIGSLLENYVTPLELNQCWIDGGMFSSTLIYVLHSFGIGSCCLNWCVSIDKDKALKKALGLPEGYAISMLLAVGNIKDRFNVAESRRFDEKVFYEVI